MQIEDKYCTLKPLFPKNAFMLYIFLLHQDTILAILPMDSIYTTPINATKGVTELIQYFKNLDKSITIPEESLIFPLKFKSLFPLKKEFWKKPELSYNPQMRLKTFTKVFDYPDFYSLLVTPFSFDKTLKKWHFNATLPILSDIKHTEIEKFMHKSDQIVEPRAKYAAIYQIEKKLRFNWQISQIKEFDNSTKKALQLTN